MSENNQRNVNINNEDIYTKTSHALSKSATKISSFTNSINDQQKTLKEIRQKVRIKEKTLNQRQSQLEKSKSDLYYQMYEFNSKLPQITEETQQKIETTENELDKLETKQCELLVRNERIDKEIMLLKKNMNNRNEDISHLEEKEDVFNMTMASSSSCDDLDPNSIELHNVSDNIQEVTESISIIQNSILRLNTQLKNQRKKFTHLADKYEIAQKAIRDMQFDQQLHSKKYSKNIADANDSKLLQTSHLNIVDLRVIEQKIVNKKIIKKIKELDDVLDKLEDKAKKQREKNNEKLYKIQEIKQVRMNQMTTATSESKYKRIKKKHISLLLAEIYGEERKIQRQEKEIAEETIENNNLIPSLEYQIIKTEHDISSENRKIIRLDAKQKELKRLEDDFAKLEEETKLKYESLLVVLNDLYEKRSRKEEEFEEIRSIPTKQIKEQPLKNEEEEDNDEKKALKEKQKNECRAYKFLNSELREKICNQVKINESLISQLKDVKAEKRKYERIVNEIKQEAVIKNLNSKNQAKENEVLQSIDISELNLKIAQKTINIEQKKQEIERKSYIIQKIADQYNMKTDIKRNALIVEDYNSELIKNNAFDLAKKENAAHILIHHFNDYLSGVTECTNRLALSLTSMSMKIALSKYNDVLSELCDDSLPRMYL